MEKLSKELLSLAGEYAVASELCRRGLYSQLTLGNHKRTDILVETQSRVLRISVKAKQDKEWPSIAGPVRDDDFLIFVDLAGKSPSSTLDFYILDRKNWNTLVETEVQIQKEKGKTLQVDSGKIVWPDGWKGLNVRPSQILDSKDRWDVLTRTVPASDTEVGFQV